jgi:hypothetical protein
MSAWTWYVIWFILVYLAQGLHAPRMQLNQMVYQFYFSSYLKVFSFLTFEI